MKYFPATCIDDFYSDPDSIRDFALKQEFFSSDDGSWPGARTKEIHLLDENFFNNFCKKLFSIFYDFDKSYVEWKVKTQFQLIKPFEDNQESLKNSGWIHFDQGTVFAGVIFLTPDIQLNTGTSLYQLRPQSNLVLNDKAKSDYYKNSIDNNYDEMFKKYNESFVETVRFNNVYNRLISFDSATAHGANSFYTEGSPRLTQVFFVYDIKSDIPSPIDRHRRYL